ncbi:octopamine receptor beta-1R [Elysia marginata]|uniref:Octopamine receptor beta-1R n=1 Tax=Elysia marginata TaxID=1093978 RepID=A0AAV4F8X5_9GAST|nr:octopamine receptor beta-1R [Elysia marginata]
MEGNDIEITVDVDVSRLVLGSFLNFITAPAVRLKSKLHKLHGHFNDASIDSTSNIMKYHQLSARPSISGNNKMADENQNDSDDMNPFLKRNRPLGSILFPQQIKPMKSPNDLDRHPHHRISLTSLSQRQFFSQPDPLPSQLVSLKELPRSFHETINQTLSANTETNVTHTIHSARPGLLSSNFTMPSPGITGAAADIVEDWNLPLASILSPRDNEPAEHQAASSSGWSGEEIGAVSIIALMVPFIICSNLMVILSIVRFRRLQIPTNYFITSLASVDVLVALATPFMIMVEVFQFAAPGAGVGGSGALLCLLPNRVLMMACSVSLLTLSTIAYDRHTALVSPLDYVVIMTSRRVRLLISLTWIYSAFVVWFPLLAGWHDNPTQLVRCSADLLHGKAHALFLSAIFVPSCGVILVCYARIFTLARHHAQAIAAVEFAVKRQVKFIMRDAKYAKTLALVIGVFLTLWLPYLVSMFVKLVAGATLSIWVQTYLMLIAVLNSGINPWIYAFKNKEFRHAFRRLYHEVFLERLCLRRFGRKTNSVQTSGYSSTPRLSRTDSRIATAVVDSATLVNVCEKLQRSLDSLDRFDKYHNRRLSSQCRAWRSGPLPGSYRALPSAATKVKRCRQALSCSDLHEAKETTAILPRSLSVELCPSIEDEHVNRSTQTANRDELFKQQVFFSNAMFPSTRCDNASFPVNDSPCSFTPNAKFRYPTHLNSTANLLLGSSHVASLSSSTSFSSPRSNLKIHRQEHSKTLPLSLQHTDSPNKNCLQSSSQSDITIKNLLIDASKIVYSDIDSVRRGDMLCLSNHISTETSAESKSPQFLNFFSEVRESHSHMPTSALCNIDETSLSHFTRTDFCSGFYPEPNSLSSSVELWVP